ncbi:hypothetical protein CG002_03305 [Mesoplasma florum]|uniref:MBL fold metallo-hydrolase n=1 Tax=Mesoplasma florum TaxID=2151 RepID=UPI000D08BBE9|nr:MBL fold metallo-hydrolase [Mesoplasma florum]AVN65365.1 hypothetical protein CG002_03305 [Mesoplasma florum]
MQKYIKNFKVSFLNDANSYLIVNEISKKAILIDGGYNANLILNYLKNNNLDLTDIFITHFHHDHIVGLDYISIQTKANIHIHEYDFEYLFDVNVNGTQNGQKVDFTNPNISFKVFDKNLKLTINDFLINVIHKGGHSKGTTFYEVDNQYLFVGDTLFIDGFGYHKKLFSDAVNHPLKNMFDKTCNDEIFFESIKSIGNEFSEHLIYPGHWKEGFKIKEIIANNNHPFNKLK